MTREINMAQGAGGMPETVIDERQNGNNRFIWRSWEYTPQRNVYGPNPPPFKLVFTINPADPIQNYIDNSTPAGVVNGNQLEFDSVSATVGNDACQEVDIEFKRGSAQQPINYNGRGIKYDVVMYDNVGNPVTLDPRIRPR